MASGLSGGQRFLCGLLAAALNSGTLSERQRRMCAGADMDFAVRTAEQHSVLPLLYDVLSAETLPENVRQRLQSVSLKTVRQSYRLLFLTRYLVRLLEEAGIPLVVLKGCGVAAYYPVPELRKSGDVDLLVRKRDAERALEVLERAGYVRLDKQAVNHHMVCRSGEGILVELHVLLAEPFDNERINECMQRIAERFEEQIVRRTCMGVEFPLLSDAYQAFQLLLHMLQHFLRAGFGLKLLCDWTVFWNGRAREEAWPEFERLAAENGVYDFARIVTECCVEFLGLCREYSEGGRNRELAERFLCDVFEAEEFGRSSAERMVAVQGTGVGAYLKEFHHQMKLNHPKTSGYVILWPFLWIVTLFVFVRNNRRLNRGSIGSIMKSAGQRGRLVRQMRLWKRGDRTHAGD